MVRRRWLGGKRTLGTLLKITVPTASAMDARWVRPILLGGSPAAAHAQPWTCKHQHRAVHRAGVSWAACPSP